MNFAQPIPDWRPSNREIRGAEINDVIRQYEVVAIHFWASWNGHDPQMDRNIRAVQPGFDGRIGFVSCNTDVEENGELIRRCGVGNIPALGIIVAGSPRRAIIGVGSPESLAEEIERRLQAPSPAPWWAFWRVRHP